MGDEASQQRHARASLNAVSYTHLSCTGGSLAYTITSLVITKALSRELITNPFDIYSGNLAGVLFFNLATDIYRKFICWILLVNLTAFYVQLMSTDFIIYELTHLTEQKIFSITPVSYTHLDVYKRQHENCSMYGVMCNLMFLIFKFSHSFPFFFTSTPVSYTHLDVYKRQH